MDGNLEGKMGGGKGKGDYVNVRFNGYTIRCITTGSLSCFYNYVSLWLRQSVELTWRLGGKPRFGSGIYIGVLSLARSCMKEEQHHDSLSRGANNYTKTLKFHAFDRRLSPCGDITTC
jgi:hypothetical protein